MEIELSEVKIEVDEFITIHAESVQMTVLFKNLISNAIKVSSKARQPMIKISGQPCKQISDQGDKEIDFYRIGIKDNGLGIDPQYKGTYSHYFQRLHSKDAYNDTGIGPASCQKIVERHGGFIQVESQLGQGICFS